MNVEQIQYNISEACRKAGRKEEEITLIGVTKYVTIERTEEALAAGVHHLGENRLEGFLQKYDAIGEKAKWHFIGSLQSRKVKDMINKIDMLHSLDRKSLAKEINKRAEKPVPCFVQINTSGEASKHGIEPEEALKFIDGLAQYDKIQVVGLMTMAPFVEDEEIIRQTFRRLKMLRDEIEEKHYQHAPCRYLSMGMSNDYQLAIEEGATHIRIGSKLVGQK
ncbi:YggS family pyridoxal phosphate-dependent enzyme [Sediminibacillus dalangtanensis]|uniref:Pyridoxal phosphate homeostasis protein n=2 Tax=Sediminibacillus dalangtanensis TaxID=2729421 RepID=A0ABX7VXM9_9BACI|nr:YggS family pyridoxal phosphate-dependent enzyme [Sediminibacillus dalangtanensis]